MGHNFFKKILFIFFFLVLFFKIIMSVDIQSFPSEQFVKENLSDEQREQISTVFSILDQDQKGSVSGKSFGEALQQFAGQESAENLMKQLNVGSDDSISKESFEQKIGAWFLSQQQWSCPSTPATQSFQYDSDSENDAVLSETELDLNEKEQMRAALRRMLTPKAAQRRVSMMSPYSDISETSYSLSSGHDSASPVSSMSVSGESEAEQRVDEALNALNLERQIRANVENELRSLHEQQRVQIQSLIDQQRINEQESSSKIAFERKRASQAANETEEQRITAELAMKDADKAAQRARNAEEQRDKALIKVDSMSNTIADLQATIQLMQQQHEQMQLEMQSTFNHKSSSSSPSSSPNSKRASQPASPLSRSALFATPPITPQHNRLQTPNKLTLLDELAAQLSNATSPAAPQDEEACESAFDDEHHLNEMKLLESLHAEQTAQLQTQLMDARGANRARLDRCYQQIAAIKSNLPNKSKSFLSMWSATTIISLFVVFCAWYNSMTSTTFSQSMIYG